MNKHVSPQMNRRSFVIGSAAVGGGPDHKRAAIHSRHMSHGCLPNQALAAA